MYKSKAFAATSPTSPLSGMEIPRRDSLLDDVQIKIQYCGVCHSDLHTVRDEWHAMMPTIYPCVPGHEIVGQVTKVGSNVSKFKVGDIVGVGCMVDCDPKCPTCQEGFEQFSPDSTFTYNSPDKYETAPVTYGGYSESIVVNQRAVLRVPSNLNLAAAAPLLCAGITTYSPLKRNHISAGKKVGIVGLGGLGHMGVKIARAMGAHVVVFTTSTSKIEDAMRLGANEVVLSNDANQVAVHAGSFDMILDTVSAAHDLNMYLDLLRRGGNMTLVGVPEHPTPINAFSLIYGNKTLSGSMIGGFAETQEMLDFCGQHSITADVEVIAIQQINEAYERMLKSQVKYRFSIDMASLTAN
jgi:uncharacterized zinc-type alcohol dehydrogenase-like protein